MTIFNMLVYSPGRCVLMTKVALEFIFSSYIENPDSKGTRVSKFSTLHIIVTAEIVQLA